MLNQPVPDLFIAMQSPQLPTVDVSKFKTFDDLITGILDEIGNKASGLVKATAGKALDVVVSATNAVTSVAVCVPFQSNFSPSGSLIGRTPEGPVLVRQLAIEQPGMETSLGQLQAPSTPAMGVSSTSLSLC